MCSAKLCFLLLCLIPAGLLVCGSWSRAQTLPSRYLGSEACEACHEELAASIAGSPHRKLAEETAPERHGCEGCHGPGSNHVNSGGDKTLLFAFAGASAAAVRRQCGACHEAGSDSVHGHRSTSCLSCHAAHHYRQKKFLLVEVPPRLCTDCHDARRMPASRDR